MKNTAERCEPSSDNVELPQTCIYWKKKGVSQSMIKWSAIKGDMPVLGGDPVLSTFTDEWLKGGEFNKHH